MVGDFVQLRRGSRVPSSRARTLTGRDKGCWLHSHRCALIVKGPRRVSSGTPLGTRVRVHYKGLTAFADGTWPLQPAEGLDALAVAPMWLMRTFPFPCLLLILRPLVARARGTGAGFLPSSAARLARCSGTWAFRPFFCTRGAASPGAQTWHTFRGAHMVFHSSSGAAPHWLGGGHASFAQYGAFCGRSRRRGDYASATSAYT